MRHEKQNGITVVSIFLNNIIIDKPVRFSSVLTTVTKETK